MSTTLLKLRTALRFRLRDTSAVVAEQQITDAQYTTLINRAQERIVTDTECLEAVATLTADGLNSSFTLVGAGEDNVAADFMAVKMIDHPNCILEAVDIEEIRRCILDDSYVPTYASKYSVFGSKIYFDKVPGSSSVTVTHGALGDPLVPFLVGDTITGTTSGATATVTVVGTLSLTVTMLAGVFVVGETITGTGLATATTATLSYTIFTVHYYKLPTELTEDTAIVYENLAVGVFEVGEVVTGADGGGTGTISTIGTLTFTLVDVTGTFAVGEEVEGGTSLATADVVTSTYLSLVPDSPLHLYESFILSAAMLEYADEADPDTSRALIKQALVMYEWKKEEFLNKITLKGKGQHWSTNAHRL